MNNIPDPKRFSSLQAWASAVFENNRLSANSVSTTVDPQPVLLPHKTTDNVDGVGPRAAQDGILMYDPALNAPVVSINGVWRVVSIAPL